MVDPFSIAGAVGLTTGLIGFLVSTIEKTVATYDEWKDCAFNLRCYGNTVLVCEPRMNQWNRAWKLRAKEVGYRYEELWGSDGWVAIRNNLQLVNQALDQVHKLLIGQYQLNSSTFDETHWSAFMSQGLLNFSSATAEFFSQLRDRGNSGLDDGRHKSSSSRWKPPVSKRLAFALFESARLETAVNRLDKLTKELNELSNAHFLESHGFDGAQAPPIEQIKSTGDLEEKTERLWKTMSMAHHRLSGDRSEWTLSLPRVENPHSRLQCNSIELHFLQSSEQGFVEGAKAQSLSIGHNLAGDESVDDLIQFLMDRRQEALQDPDEGTIDCSLKYLFRRATREGRNEHRRFRHSQSVQNASAALTIATWVSLLGPSPWLHRFCCCGIRYIDFANGESCLMYSADVQHAGIRCFGEVGDLHSHPYLLYGTVLAEIGLARPLYIRMKGTDIRFSVLQEDNSEWNVSESRLLELVYTATKSRAYEEAVSACLKWDRRCGLRSRLLPHDVLRYIEDVIQPLHEYFEAVQHRRNARGRELNNIIDRGWNTVYGSQVQRRRPRQAAF